MADRAVPMTTPNQQAEIPWQSTSATISATCLVAPYIPPAKPWHRVPVPAANRRNKIWKRSGGPVTVSETAGYAAALVELDCQGHIGRKRARTAEFIPAWGDASWDAKAGNAKDGKCDLAEARAFVSGVTAAEAAAVEITGSINSKTATFAEEKLRWVPRKRHNTRWPIEPEIETTGMGADSQLFDIPAANRDSIQAEDVVLPADAKQMRRRSTRRLSRRVSFAPVDDLIQSPTASASPMRGSPTRSPRRLSPMKVSGSPKKTFTMMATPSKVVLAAPLGASSPGRSPLKQPRLSPVNETAASSPQTSEIDSSPFLSDALPLLFDQPIPDVQVEPEHEARRRVSLQNARRSDRRSSGIRGLVAFEAMQSAPSRRHSFLHTDSRQAEAKGRRHTLGVFGVETGEIRLEVTSPPTDQHPEPIVSAQEPDARPQAAVVVDVGTNLDIFGQSPEQPRPRMGDSPVGRINAGYDSPTEMDTDMCLSAETGSVAGDVTSSPIANVFGLFDHAVTDEAMMSDQAAAGTPPMPDDETQHPDVDHSTPPIEFASPETSDSCNDDEQSDMFLPHDPEGLSTIFEESFATDVAELPQDEVAVALDVEQATPPGQDKVLKSSSATSSCEPLPEQAVSPPCTPEEDEASEDGSPESNDTDGPSTPTSATDLAGVVEPRSKDCVAGDHEPPVTPSPKVSTGVPADTSINRRAECDQLVSTHSAKETADAPNGPPLENTLPGMPWQSLESPTPSDDSVAMPEDDFCGTVLIDLESPGQASVHTDLNLELADQAPTAAESHSVTAFEEVGSTALTRPHGLSAMSDIPAGIDVRDGETDAVPETPPGQNTGFTPINDRRISPSEPSPTFVDGVATEADELDDTQNDGIVTAMDYEPTVPIEDVISDLTNITTLPDNGTLAVQEDSETELLRKFVTRVKANKSAKAAAAALAKRSLRPKRRSGSTGSTTSTTGSPIARSESPAKRLPLSERDLNSPSPTKKRKAAPIGGDDFFKGKTTLFSEESSPPLKTKRRRKRLAAELETTLEQSMPIVEPDPEAAETGLRRSTRSRNTRVQLKPPAPSANTIALSMIPVRLPGSSGTMADMDRDMPAIVIPKTRNEEKDLAAVTRLNTRKNKANAVPPKMVLACQAEDPAAWRMKELKSVFDAKEGREAADAAAADDDDSDQKGAGKTRTAKGVRWAEELVRFQGEEGADTAAPPVSKLGANNAVGETAAAAPVVPAVAEPEETSTSPASTKSPEEVPELEKQPAAKKPPPPKRTRASRLQMPTPIRGKAAAAASATVSQTEKPAVRRPAKRSAAAAASSSSSSSSVVRMATRRTKIASLGMSANGTPAPKRRTRTTT